MPKNEINKKFTTIAVNLSHKKIHYDNKKNVRA